MNTNTLWISRSAVASVLCTISACAGMTTASTATVDAATKKFAKIVTSSSDALKIEEKAKPGVRRDETIMFYLAHGDDDKNITASGVPRSFGNYVCAGTGALRKARAFLTYAQSYATSATGITQPGGDSFAGQWSKFVELRQPPDVKDAPSAASKASAMFDECITRVAGQIIGAPHASSIEFAGTRASDTSDEAVVMVSAVFEAFKALYGALTTAAKDGLKVVNEVESRKKFTQFVTQQHEKFQAALSQTLSADKLNEAWERRKTDALWQPYYTFAKMMSLSRGTQKAQIVAIAAVLRDQMAAYDALAATDSPGAIVKSLAAAEDQLFQVASDNNVSLSTAISVLTAIEADVTQLKSDYVDVVSKAEAARAAL